jgi:hypothetical protein
MRSSRLGASERFMIVVYSLAVSPDARTRSLSRWRGRIFTIRMRDLQITSSDGLNGSTLAI